MTGLSSCVFKITSHVINLDENGKPDGEIEKDEFTAKGKVGRREGTTLLSYEEKRDGASVSCEILIKDDEVKVLRRGDVISEMVFAVGKTHESVYRVPPFSFDMKISTSRIENDEASLALFYEMSVGGAEKRCRMKIERLD